MNKILYITLLFLSIASPSKTIMESCKKNIQDIIPNIISIKHDIYKLTETDKETFKIVKQGFFKNELNVWIISSKEDSIKYYAILDNVIGKTMPISFLAIYDNHGSVYNVSVIKYREQYGGQIKSKKWLKQFINYTDTSNYNIGKNISAISGATISVHSISKGIHKLSIIINNIMESFDEK